MRLSVISAALSALAVQSFALPTAHSDHVVHEKRNDLQHKWIQGDTLESDYVFPARIGLKQNNLELGALYLHEVSDPSSPRYGQHYTTDEVTNLFAPSAVTVDSVLTWVHASGIHKDRLSQSANKAWLQFDASVEEMEQLLKTKYHFYEHANGGRKHISCEDYKIPAAVSQHIDYVTRGVKLLATRALGDMKRKRGSASLNSHAQPSYQQTAINSFSISLKHILIIFHTYFAYHNPPYPYYSSLNGTIGANDGIYNRIGRGFPDFSAVGDNGALVVKGQDTIGGGTSMSAPLVAALFTRINDERIAVGKGPIGFANPTLYANPQMFNDITVGDQSRGGGCGTSGFSCVPGWDPVTKLVTPKYAQWLEVFLALP